MLIVMRQYALLTRRMREFKLVRKEENDHTPLYFFTEMGSKKYQHLRA